MKWIQPARFGGGGGGGGPLPAWYDVETFPNTNTLASSASGELEWSPVSVTTGGSATKARIYLADNSGGSNIKMGIYAAAGGAVLASGSGTIADATSDDNAYFEVTFSAPAAVTDSTTYLIAWIADTGNLSYRYRSASGNWKADTGFGYSSFPGTLPAHDFDLSRGYAVSLYVE